MRRALRTFVAGGFVQREIDQGAIHPTLAVDAKFESVRIKLGVGVKAPAPSLGLMIAESESSFAIAPHLLIFPAIAIVLTVLGFLLVGDGLRDALDVKDT